MKPPRPTRRTTIATSAKVGTSAIVAVVIVLGSAAAQAATPAELLDGYRNAAGAAPAPARGQKLFTTPQGREWSCATCHGALPTQAGKHASTGKPIGALAPAFNAERFTDGAKVEKWFRRNCNDVVGRECTAIEKADLMAWLLTLKP